MGGYVAYTLAINNPELLGDIMSLGTKLKWNAEEAQKETRKLDPDKIEEKVPKFANYLDSLHLDWKKNMIRTIGLMNGLGNGKALTRDDFSLIRNKCFTGLAENDEMVSREETLAVSQVIPDSTFFILQDSRHPLSLLDEKLLSDLIINFLK